MIILYSCWYCAASKIQESRGPLERRRRENSSVPETEQKHNLKGPTSASVKQYSDIHPVVQMSKLHFWKIHNRGRHGAVRAWSSTREHVSVEDVQWNSNWTNMEVMRKYVMTICLYLTMVRYLSTIAPCIGKMVSHHMRVETTMKHSSGAVLCF